MLNILKFQQVYIGTLGINVEHGQFDKNNNRMALNKCKDWKS